MRWELLSGLFAFVPGHFGCWGPPAPPHTRDFAHAAAAPGVRRCRAGWLDRQGRVQCALCCLVLCFVACCVFCSTGACCARRCGRAVHGAGSGVACSRAEAGRRVRVACWARAGRHGGRESDLHRVSGERFFSLEHEQDATWLNCVQYVSYSLVTVLY